MLITNYITLHCIEFMFGKLSGNYKGFLMVSVLAVIVEPFRDIMS